VGNEPRVITAALAGRIAQHKLQLADIAEIDGTHAATLVRGLVLGGTGSIGGPIVRELMRRGHAVVALARSEASARQIGSS